MRGAARPLRQRKIHPAALLYANYLPDEGHIHIRHGDEWVDLVQAPARKVLEVRRTTIGWVSQFLRVIPRISALDVVMQPLLDLACRAKPAPPKPPAC
jgi:alpha-D-ribose 1-methylphosphonate 5-triphosphate synthase subunit PhnL